jgi:DNA polymerase-3 subunit gamma/tau
MASGEAYLGLARKWRPQTFGDLVGQESVAESFCQALRQKRVSHGHIMAGPRGVGKTTSARILAKALNCEKGPTPTPCGECRHCREITLGNHMDVIEIDAASNNGVDHVRELQERINLAPFSARHKVYIIDEVHMMSTPAFNALLKTLEEPPAGVIFILATTELEKVPETIRSRCQVHQFRRMTTEDIVRRLRQVAEGEGATMDAATADRVLGHIARSVDGGMRDALMLLDQLLALTGGAPDEESALKLLGLADPVALADTVDWIAEGAVENLLRLVGELVERGRNLERFVKELSAYLRDLMILQAGVGDEMVGSTGETLQRARRQAAALDPATLYNMINQIFELEERLKRSAQARFLIEFTFLRLARVKAVVSLDQIIGRINALPDRAFEGSAPLAAQPAPPSPSPVSDPEVKRPIRRASAAPASQSPVFLDSSSEPGSPVAAPHSGPDETVPVAFEGAGDAEIVEMILAELPENAQFLSRYLRQTAGFRFEANTLWMAWPADAAGLGRTLLEKPENVRYIDAALTQLAGRPMKLAVHEAPAQVKAPEATAAPGLRRAAPAQSVQNASGVMADSHAEVWEQDNESWAERADEGAGFDSSGDDGYGFDEDRAPLPPPVSATAPPVRRAMPAPPPPPAAEPVDSRSALERAQTFLHGDSEAARRLKFMQDFFQGHLIDDAGQPLPV